jgi:ribulose-phosphate 3-epimerase
VNDLNAVRKAHLQRVRGQWRNLNSSKLIAPSILSADFATLGQEIASVESASADWIHVDVMDGHFVPNLTLGAPVVSSLAKVSRLPLDCHLMISNPLQYIADFAKSGADIITLHIEALTKPESALKAIRDLGCWAGLTLTPSTPLSAIEKYLSFCDLVLVMTVNPGFSGQGFMSDAAEKVSRLAQIRKAKNLDFLIEVDGGINSTTKTQVTEADILVAGNAVFKATDYKVAIASLR